MTAWSSKEFWERDHHHSHPIYPLNYDFVYGNAEEGTRQGFAEWSLLMDRFRLMRKNGWQFSRMEPFGGDPPAIMAKVPVLGHLWRIHPVLGPRVRGMERWLKEGGMQANLDIWERVRPEAERRLKPLREANLASLSNSQLSAHLDALADYMGWSWTKHVNIHVICGYFKGLFAKVCRELLGLSDTEAYELLQRSDPILFDATARITAMARKAEQDPEVLGVLDLPADQALSRLKGTWFEEDLNGFLDAWGDGPVNGWEFTDTTWRDMPELVVALVKQQIGSDYDPVAEDAEFQAYRTQRIAELRSRLTGASLARFDQHLLWGEKAYPLNDVHNYLLFDIVNGLLRYATLEAGRRLVASDAISTPEDVFHLTRPELMEALGRRTNLHDVVARRRAEREAAMRLQPPPHLGTPPPKPNLKVMPPQVREAMEILLSQVEQTFGSNPPAAAPGQVAGLAGAPGIAEGIARVVKGFEDFAKLQPGDILVCPMTTPAWTPLFPLVAGMVTDIGGPLCHAAIIAREYGKPAVVGTQTATRTLRDGQRIRVDGNAGVVQVLGEPDIAEAS